MERMCGLKACLIKGGARGRLGEGLCKKPGLAPKSPPKEELLPEVLPLGQARGKMSELDQTTQARVIATLLDEIDELRAENARLRRISAIAGHISAMPMRRIPQTDLDVSAVCLGTWQF